MTAALKPIRRVVTGNDEHGRSRVLFDSAAPNANPGPIRPGTGMTDIWVYKESPAPLSGVRDDGNLPFNFEPPDDGGHLRIVQSPAKPQGYDPARDPKAVPLHEPRPGEPYYLGVFLMGAYQDVLGSAHNLFGKVNEAHVRVTPDGEPQIELFVRGQKARRVIESMGYEAPDLSGHVELDVNRAMKAGLVNAAEAETFMELYNEELVGYTYLED